MHRCRAVVNVTDKVHHAAGQDGLWPLAEGTFIIQLLESCGSSDTAVAAVASTYHLLLEALPILAGATGQGDSTVSALAFGCNILKRLWRSVSVSYMRRTQSFHRCSHYQCSNVSER